MKTESDTTNIKYLPSSYVLGDYTDKGKAQKMRNAYLAAAAGVDNANLKTGVQHETAF